jgi:outer membrane protein assembly factor BamB
MWRWQNLVIVTTRQIDNSQPPLSLLTGLDASTGQARWALPGMGGTGDPLSLTADGGFAVAVDQHGALELEVLDLSSGRVRWTHPVDSDAVAPVAVSGGAVVFAGGADGDANGSLTSYDDRTGQVRWTEPLKPVIVGLQAFAGLLYVQAEVPQAQPTDTTALVELLATSPADGRVKWRFTPSQPEAPEVSAAGLVSIGASLDQLDPATGQVRWHVASPYPAVATPAGIVATASGPDGTDQISVRDPMTGRIRWTAELAEPLPGDPWQSSPSLPLFQAGPLLVVPAVGPDGSEVLAALRMSDGHPAWQLTIPGLVEAPPSAAAGGMLVYAAIAQMILAP